MKGLKWRTTKSPVEFMLVKNWGATPTPYDWSQLYSGLQSGVVEGQYVASPWQHVAKLHEVAKYFTEIGGMWLSLIHISEPTRPLYISYAVFCLKKKKQD